VSNLQLAIPALAGAITIVVADELGASPLVMGVAAGGVGLVVMVAVIQTDHIPSGGGGM